MSYGISNKWLPDFYTQDSKHLMNVQSIITWSIKKTAHRFALSSWQWEQQQSSLRFARETSVTAVPRSWCLFDAWTRWRPCPASSIPTWSRYRSDRPACGCRPSLSHNSRSCNAKTHVRAYYLQMGKGQLLTIQIKIKCANDYSCFK